MKKFLSLAFVCVACRVFPQPQDLPSGVKLAPSVQPPSIVGSRFSELYRGYNPEWKQDGSIYRATVSNGPENTRTVYFTGDGTLVRTDSLLGESGRPRQVDRFLALYDRGAKRPLWLVRDSSGAWYFAPSSDDTLQFDGAGRLKPKDRHAALVPQEEAIMLRDAAAELLMQGSLAELAVVNAGSDAILTDAKESLRVSHENFTALERTAASVGVNLPSSLDPAQKKTAELTGLCSGKAFDKRYVKEMSASKKRFARLTRRISGSSENAAVKAWASGAQR